MQASEAIKHKSSVELRLTIKDVSPKRRFLWRHQMKTFSALLAICARNSPVIGEFPAQRPVTRSFEVFFDLRLNKLLCKQWWGWWFETPSRRLWRHCNGLSFIHLCLIMPEPFWWCNGNLADKFGQNHGCWCPCSLRRQVISSDGINYAG